MRLLPVLLLTAAAPALADDVAVKPAGEYATIDAASVNGPAEALLKGPASRREEVEAALRARPGAFAPPVLMAFSKLLFERGEKDEAAFWFYAGQLRARYDANRCLDATAGQAVGALNQLFGPPINQHAFQDVTALEATIGRVLAWDEATPHDYEHRWIALHGMGAVLSGLAPGAAPGGHRFAPRERWGAIAAETRRDYQAGFAEALVIVKVQRDPKASPWLEDPEGVRYVGLRGIVQVKGVDPATFQVLSRDWARDGKKVYARGRALEGADPASFAPLDGEVGRDAGGVWTGSKRLAGADAATFRRVRDGVYADRAGAFVEQHGDLTRIEGADPETLERLNFWFVKDARTVFASVTGPIPGADAASFRLGGCGACETCAQDRNRCYWFQHPVPCDCKGRNEGQFAGGQASLPAGHALLRDRGVTFLLEGTAWKRSFGALVVPAGVLEVPFECFDRGTGAFRPPGGLKSNRLYLLEEAPGPGCEARLVDAAMVRGRADGPAIWLVLDGPVDATRPASASPPRGPTLTIQTIQPPSRRTFTARCREVTRTEVVEKEVEVTIDLAPGDVWDLEGTFAAPAFECLVRPVLRGARPGQAPPAPKP